MKKTYQRGPFQWGLSATNRKKTIVMTIFSFIVMALMLFGGAAIIFFSTLREIDFVESFLISFAVNAIVIPLTFLGLAIGNFCNEKDCNEVNIKLYGLSSTTSVEGRFVVGCGSIGTARHIFFNIKDEDGLINTLQLGINRCRFDIMANDDETVPYVTIVERRRTCKNKFGHLFYKEEFPLFSCGSYAVFHIHGEEFYAGNYYDIRK